MFSLPPVLVALRPPLHDQTWQSSQTAGRTRHPRLPQQSDQPLPVHDHQQGRQGQLEEFLPME